MNIEKMREEFKHWESEADDGPQTDPIWLMFDLDLNQFALVEIQSRWEAWRASRESLVIELPTDTRIRDEDLSRFDVKDSCQSAIEAAGLKVKS